MATVISGSTLAMLMYDHSSTLGNQEGLLTGRIVSHVKDTISDSQINNVRVEIITYIYGCTCQSRFESFQDNRGNILNFNESAAVGWYRYRHNTTHQISMKEKSIHQSLLKRLPQEKRDNFLFVLCTSKKSENMSTCDFDYNFYKYDLREKRYTAVPVTVVNLGDTTHTEYKCTKSCTVNYDSGALGSLLATFEHELLGDNSKSAEAVGVQHMAESLQTQLQCLTHGVMESDREVYRLHSELEKLEEELEKKKKENKLLLKPTNSSSALPDTAVRQKWKATEQDIARSKKSPATKEEHYKSLYPNLSDLKVSAGGSRTRHLSEDYLMEDDLMNSSDLQRDKKSILLDSPNELAETEPECVQSNPSVHQHIDIPFADGEKSATNDGIKSDDPFSFVDGMIKNSKSGVLKKKANNSTDESKNMKDKPNESNRKTRSRNTTLSKSSESQNHKDSNDRQNKASQSKETSKLCKDVGSSDCVTTEEKDNNCNGVIDISSSPVF